MSTTALSRWNSGKDPALNLLSDAKAAVAARGFSAASGGRARAQDIVRRALDAEPNPDLPTRAKTAFYREQDRLARSAAGFFKDADEYSGKSSRGVDIPEPMYRRRQREAEDAAKREAEAGKVQQGVLAADYWERNPTSKKTATVTDYSGDPEVAKAIASGDISAVEKATFRAAKRRAQLPGATAEIVSSSPNEPTVTRNSAEFGGAQRVFDVMDLASRAKNSGQPDLAKFKETAPERAQKIRDLRAANERSSKEQYANFIQSQDRREQEDSKAEEQLRSLRKRDRALRSAQAEAVASGRVLNDDFWNEYEDTRANLRNVNRMSRSEQLAWAKSQVKEREAAYAERERIARQNAEQQAQLLQSISSGKASVSDLLGAFFNGN